MNTITKDILKAVVIESTGTILLASAFYALFFSFAETKEFFEALWLPILFGFLAMCFAGLAIGNSFSPGFKFKVWHGVAIIFLLLMVAIVASVLTTLLLSNWDFDIIQNVISVTLVSLSFGGLPTLIVGFWLGYRLKNRTRNCEATTVN